MYIAEYPGYVNLGGTNAGTATRWINDLASNALNPTITLNYSGQTNFNAAFTDDGTGTTTFKAFKGQTFSQTPLLTTLTNEAGNTETRAQYIIDFYSESGRTTLVPGTFAYDTAATLYVKATQIGVTSLVLENTTANLNITATPATIGSLPGYTITVPVNSTGFKRMLATANAPVRTDLVVSGDVGLTFGIDWFRKLDGALTTFDSTQFLDPTKPATSTFGIWQIGGTDGNWTFETPRVITVYNKIIFSDDTHKVLPVKITVPDEILNDEATLGLVATTGAHTLSSNTSIATVAITGTGAASRVVITPIAQGAATITVGDGTKTATIAVTVGANGDMTNVITPFAV
jgi:hypothetical protein